MELLYLVVISSSEEMWRRLDICFGLDEEGLTLRRDEQDLPNPKWSWHSSISIRPKVPKISGPKALSSCGISSFDLFDAFLTLDWKPGHVSSCLLVHGPRHCNQSSRSAQSGDDEPLGDRWWQVLLKKSPSLSESAMEPLASFQCQHLRPLRCFVEFDSRICISTKSNLRSAREASTDQFGTPKRHKFFFHLQLAVFVDAKILSRIVEASIVVGSLEASEGKKGCSSQCRLSVMHV